MKKLLSFPKILALNKYSCFLLPLAIFIIALTPRLTYFSHLNAVPYFSTLFPGFDQYTFVEKATAIATTDLIGNEPFSHAPLYLYFLALIIKLFGHSLPAIRLFQFIVGAFSCMLIFWIGKEVFDVRVGILAGIVAAFCPVSLFYEGIILRAAFAAFMNLVLLAVLLLAFRRRHSLWWVLSGVSFGLCVLVRPNIAIFFPFLLLWIWIAFNEEVFSSRIRRMIEISLGILLVLALLVGRNLAAGVSPFSLSEQGAIVFYIGNASDAYGVGYSIPDSYNNAQKDHLIIAALTSILQDPLSYAKLMGRKFLALLNGFEIPNNMNFYIFQQFSWLLRNPVFSFTALSPLGMLGLFFSFRASKKAMLLGLFFIAGLLSVWMFYILSRFRYPMVPVFIIFSAWSIVWCWDSIRERKLKHVAIAAAFGVPLVLISIPRPFTCGYIRAEDFFNLGVAYMLEKQYSPANESFKKGLIISPHFKPMQVNYFLTKGLLYYRQNQYEKASSVLRKALKLKPKSQSVQQCYFLSLGMLYLQNRQYEKASEAFREVLKIRPDLVSARKKLKYCMEKMNAK